MCHQMQKNIFGKCACGCGWDVLDFRAALLNGRFWETDFYTPPVLGGAALLPFSAPAVYKNPVP